jgi:hypothetical protein
VNGMLKSDQGPPLGSIEASALLSVNRNDP